VVLRKVPSSLVRGRQEYLARGNTLVKPVPFVRSKDKRFVLLDRTTECGSELILLVWRHRIIEEALRVQHIVPQEFIEIAVHRICPGFCDDVDYRTGVTAVLGIKCVCDHPEFFDGIGGRLNSWAIHENIVAVPSIYHVVV